MPNSTNRINRSGFGYNLPKVEISFTEETEKKASKPLPKIDKTDTSPTEEPQPEIREVTRVVNKAERRRLPSDRQALIHKFSVDKTEGYLTVGLYEDGTPGELFIRLVNGDTTTSGLLDAFAISVSLGLQYGIPLEVMAGKLLNQEFIPNGPTQNPTIPQASSLVDYIGQWLAFRFLSPEALTHLQLATFGTVSNEQLPLPGSSEPTT
jgi:ribonucleoside-diphosphate reductase alpha chain